jgi:nucleoside-diphosphate-sugar epimerase
MRIAVTGATGFVGHYVIKSLVKQGYEVLAIGRSAPEDNNLVTFIQFDLLKEYDYAWISEYKPSHLLHLAWYAEHGKFWDSSLNLNWCDATVRLIDSFCSYGGKRVVVAGSCAEYDWSFGYCKEENTPINPKTLYGITKDSARRMSSEICRLNNVSFAWGRIFFPFGSGENSNRLIPSITQALLGNRPLFSIGTQQWRDILPVEIVADALVFLLTQNHSGIFNICSGRPIQLCEIIRQVALSIDEDPQLLLSQGVEQSQSPNFLIGDSSLITTMGWKPVYDLWENLHFYVKSIADMNSSSKR